MNKAKSKLLKEKEMFAIISNTSNFNSENKSS